ncbi:FG-GAP-like repeat-containing protein, partial [Pseudovibrio denitrificans]
DQKQFLAPQFDKYRYELSAFSADFNGDRITDVARWKSTKDLSDGQVYGPLCYTTRSDKSVTTTKNCGTSSLGKFGVLARRDTLTKYVNPLFFSNTTGGLPRIADFDGDGQDDVISDNSHWFSRSEVKRWSNVRGERTADFNGDGRADLTEKKEGFTGGNLYINHSNSPVKVRLSNGISGFDIHFDSPKAPGALFGDFNGDGLTDFLHRKSKYELQIYFSAGLKFAHGPIISRPEFKDNNTIGSLAGDLNGDGRADFIGNRDKHIRLYLTRTEGLYHYPSENHGDFIRVQTLLQLADADGDGFTDLITHKEKSPFFLSPGKLEGNAYSLISERPDMLVGVVLPSGGHLSASYTTYGGDAEDERWFPPVLTVLASLTEKPNSSQAFTTRFAYSGGRWDFDNRRFAGFKKIITTLPKLAGETK